MLIGRSFNRWWLKSLSWALLVAASDFHFSTAACIRGNQESDFYFSTFFLLFRSSRTGAFEFNSTVSCSRSPRPSRAWRRAFARTPAPTPRSITITTNILEATISISVHAPWRQRAGKTTGRFRSSSKWIQESEGRSLVPFHTGTLNPRSQCF